MPIFDHEPTTWSELQDMVGQLFDELGCAVDIGKRVALVRGEKEIDVLVKDPGTYPPSVYLCECKYWSKAVHQEVVHSFRTVVADFGANRGIIVSKEGFQSGAAEAAKNTNIDLLTFRDLQEAFWGRWIESIAMRFMPYADALFPYWDPTGGKRPPQNWGPPEQEALHRLLEAYAPFCRLGPGLKMTGFKLKLPMVVPVLDDSLSQVGAIELATYRQFYDFIDVNKQVALFRYKRLFGEEK